ncbi:MAG: hypothetical protein AAGE03_03920, partial [Pseudomonadota bacterium]
MTATPLLPSPVLQRLENKVYSGDPGDYMDVGHHGSLELASGTISLSFSVSGLAGEKAILAKDGRGHEEGGHL